MSKRKVEVFTEGCARCEPTVALVKNLACKSCEVIVWDVKKGCETNKCRDLAKQYGINRYPSVAIDGKLLECCKNGEGPTEESLKAAGLGQEL